MLKTFKQIFSNYLSWLAFSQQHFWIAIKKFNSSNLEYHCRLADVKFTYPVHNFLILLKLLKYFYLAGRSAIGC